jgi:hypothetical protein
VDAASGSMKTSSAGCSMEPSTDKGKGNGRKGLFAYRGSNCTNALATKRREGVRPYGVGGLLTPARLPNPPRRFALEDPRVTFLTHTKK